MAVNFFCAAVLASVLEETCKLAAERWAHSGRPEAGTALAL